jgi:hypothetical protein
MNNSLRSVPKLCFYLILDFLLTLSNICPVVWQYDDEESVILGTRFSMTLSYRCV